LKPSVIVRKFFVVAVSVPAHARPLARIAFFSAIRKNAETDHQGQRDFFEHHLRHDESRREKADYIRDNPIRKKLVARPKDWPFVYFGDGERPQFDR